MKAFRFSKAQIAFVLRQANEGTSAAELCRKAGVSQAKFYNGRKKYAGLLPSEMKRLRQLEDENNRLRRSWPIERSTRLCCRTFCQKSTEACSSGPACL